MPPSAAPEVLPNLAGSTPGEALPTPSPRKGRLLIVDDEEGPRQSLKLIFRDDYEILLAADGPAAIGLAREQRVDVAVLDIRMTGMSGIELLERLKYVDPGMEVVMMTAFETTDTMRQALRLRAFDYINKPFDVATVRAAVARAMQKRTLEGELNTTAEKSQELAKELQQLRLEQEIAHTRGEIYASIIHDMNGPLTVISGYVQLLNYRIGNAMRLEQDDVEFVRERLKTITRQVTNCIEISRRYLSFLRRGSEDTPRVPVNQLLADCGQLLRVHPSRQGHQLSIQPLAEDVTARINGTDLIQVLLNLTVNALQCTAEMHSVTVEGSVLHEPLDLTIFKDGIHARFLNVESFDNRPPLLRLSVRDTGPGIPAEVLPNIFQPGFSTKDSRQGTGLGLSIVQRLVKEAHGALHVQTEPGQGTAFTGYFPALPAIGT